MTSAQPVRQRAALATCELLGALALIIGLITGLTSRRTTQFGGADCGSVLGGGGEDLTTTGMLACDRALSTATTWTWILLVLGVLLLIVGWVVDTMQKNAWNLQHGTTTTP